MPAQPAIPQPPHTQVDSMLSRRFGKETVNYFSGSPLNRLSFLRTEHPFLSAALSHPSSRYLLFNDLAPLAENPAQLAYASFKDVESVVPKTFFEPSEDQMIKEFDSAVTIPQLVFLGLDESQKESDFGYKIYTGTPYFALDVTPRGTTADAAKGVIAAMEAKGLSFQKGRMMSFPADQAAIFGQSRAILDWNARNTFCGTCGQRTLSVNAGTKRACPPADKARQAAGQDPARPECNTRTTISNLSFPRTDPTVIAAVISHDGKRILLGRNKRFPPSWYSTLAGFVEPAESAEDAVRREVWEESGVTLSRVVIHSTQPWPYPANLMIGAIAQVGSPEHETINLEHDPELEDAKWFDIPEVEEALRVGVSALGDPAGPEYKEGGLRLPPPTAIANQLITAAIKGDLFAQPQDSKI